MSTLPSLVLDLGGGSIKVGFSNEDRPNCYMDSAHTGGFPIALSGNFVPTDFGFTAFLGAYKYRNESSKRLSRYCVIIDSGYSFTHIIPIADGSIMKDFVIRYLDVRSELYIMNQCKEDVCYVSTDFSTDLDITHSNSKSNSILREYVLPDYVDVHRGYVRDPSLEDKPSQSRTNASNQSQQQQGYTIRMNNERFTVPELLFYPSDVGYTEMGLVEAMHYLLCERLPVTVRPGAWANCMAMGGNVCFPGFSDRLMNDLRSLAPDDLPVNLFTPTNPQTYAWEGGAQLCTNKEAFNGYLVTRAQYEEYGSSYCEKRFPVS